MTYMTEWILLQQAHASAASISLMLSVSHFTFILSMILFFCSSDRPEPTACTCRLDLGPEHTLYYELGSIGSSQVTHSRRDPHWGNRLLTLVELLNADSKYDFNILTTCCCTFACSSSCSRNSESPNLLEECGLDVLEANGLQCLEAHLPWQRAHVRLHYKFASTHAFAKQDTIWAVSEMIVSD